MLRKIFGSLNTFSNAMKSSWLFETNWVSQCPKMYTSENIFFLLYFSIQPRLRKIYVSRRHVSVCPTDLRRLTRITHFLSCKCVSYHIRRMISCDVICDMSYDIIWYRSTHFRHAAKKMYCVMAILHDIFNVDIDA